MRAAQIQKLIKILGGIKAALDPLPVHLSRAATSDQFGALAQAIDQQMSDLGRRQQDWRSARDKEAAELREKVTDLDKTVKASLRAWTSLRVGTSGVCGPGRLHARVIMFPAIAFLMDWVRHVTGW